MNNFIEYNEKTIKSQIKKYIKKNTIIIPIIGKNGTGKTRILNLFKKEVKDNNICFYIGAEFDYEKTLNNFFDETIKILNKEEKSERNKVLKKINKTLPTDDQYFIKDFNNIFIYNKKKQEIEKNKNFEVDQKWPSGIFLYSLLIVLITVLKSLKNKKGERKFLIIDELEKYAHNTLIIKICKTIIELSKSDINIVFSTHSSSVLKETWEELNRQYHQKQSKIKYFLLCLDYQNDKSYYKEFNLDEMKKNLSNINYRELKIVFDSLFSEHIFLVEGLKDYELIVQILTNKFPQIYFNIYDCYGKQIVLKINEILNKFGINKSFTLLDSDKETVKSNLEYCYIFKTDIEKFMDDKTDSKSDLSEYTWKNIDKKIKTKEGKELFKNIQDYINRYNYN